jgi:hypothetical protein
MNKCVVQGQKGLGIPGVRCCSIHNGEMLRNFFLLLLWNQVETINNGGTLSRNIWRTYGPYW